MNPTSLTTAAIQPKAQVQTWRDWFWPMLEVSPQQPCSSFVAENNVWDLGGLLMSKVSAPPVRVARKKYNLSKAPVDHWVITYCRAGGMTYRTDRVERHVPAGVPFLWSLGDASECVRDHVDRVQIFMPRDAFQDISSLIDENRSSTFQSPFGLLLAGYIDLLERNLSSMSDVESARLGVATRSLIAASFAPSSDRIENAKSGMMLGTMERIRKVVQTHLTSPSLGPAFLSRELGISRSQLYRIFEYYSGVERYIRTQRLSKVFQLLSDPMQRTPIEKMAKDFLFADASSFSRAFRQEFGCSPTDVRNAAKCGTLVEAIPRARRQTASSRFSDLFTVA